MNNLYIETIKAYSLVEERDEEKAIMKLPYKVRVIDYKNRVNYVKKIPLKYLTRAMTCRCLKHSVLEQPPQKIDISTISPCYLFGSSVNSRYEKIVKRYLWGLLITEREKQVKANDLDIICFVNNTYDASHIKSLTTWTITIQSGYGEYTYDEYGSFDISYYPVSLINQNINKDFINMLKEQGVCIMGKNIIRAKRYALWEHNVIKDTISCFVPKEQNVFSQENEEEEEASNRLDLLDL